MWSPVLRVLLVALPAIVCELSVPRSALAGGAAGGVFLFAGGNLANGSASSVVDVYDAVTGVWSASVINLSVPRYYLASASSEPLVIFAGGADLGGRVYDVVDTFNVNTRAWSSTSTGAGRLGSKRNYLAGAALNGYFMFGGGSTVSSPSADVDLYVGATGSWEYFPSALSEPRSSLAAAAAANRIVFSGGIRSGVSSSAVDVYNLVSRTWSSTSFSLSLARAYLTATAFGDTILIVGGACPLYAIDVLNLSTGTSTNTSFGPARADLASITVGDVAVFAGGSYSSYLDVYNFTDALFNSTGSLSTARSYMGAASWKNVAVFAGGAYNSSGFPLSSVEIITFPLVPDSPVPSSCVGPAPIAFAVCTNGRWVIEESLSLSEPALLGLDPVVILGDLTQNNKSIITSSDTAGLNLTGIAMLDGPLVIQLSSKPSVDVLVAVVTSSAAILGNFSTVTITSPPLGGGCGYNANQRRAQSSLSVLVSPKSCAKSGLRAGVLAAIVTASAVAAAIIFTLIVYALIRAKVITPTSWCLHSDTETTDSIR